jgi:GTP-binding protein EngB required for normal cell division
VARIEQAMTNGQASPLPPEPLLKLYRQVFCELPLLKLGGGEMASNPAPNVEIAVVPEVPSAQQQPPTLSASTRPEATVCPGPISLPELSGFLTRAREMITSSGIEPLLREWRKIYARQHEPVFSVAFVGEFSRGKSTLVNRLLDMDILPVGELPTTAMLMRVVFGPQPTMWRIQPDRKREQLPLAPESWAQLTADDEGNDPQGVVQIEIPHPWLQQTRIELIDTPGAGDLTGTRAAITAESIANCDATLVLVSATMALSLTERAFIEEHVLLARVPRVAVVLSRLDQVAQPERESVIRHVKEQLRSWAPQAALWCANDSAVIASFETLSAVGPTAIREKITEWAGDENRMAFRHRQLAAQLQDLLMVVLGTLESQKSSAASSDADRERAKKKLCRDLESSGLDWEELRLDLDKRALELESWLEQTVLVAQRAIIDALSHELSRTPNPKEWWKEELPYRLNRELIQLSRSLTQNTQARIGQDLAWFAGEVGKRFSWRIPSHHYQGEERISPVAITPSADSLSDIRRLQYATRLGGPALILVASAISHSLFGIGSLLGAAAALVGEAVSRKKATEQRQVLTQALVENVEQAMHEAIQEMRTRLRSFYQRVLEDALRQQGVWLETQQKAAALANHNDAGQIAALDQAMKKVADLCLEISETLSRT